MLGFRTNLIVYYTQRQETYAKMYERSVTVGNIDSAISLPLLRRSLCVLLFVLSLHYRRKIVSVYNRIFNGISLQLAPPFRGFAL